MVNKITVLIDVVTERANASIKGFRQSISEADGFTNKFKAGWASLGETMRANPFATVTAGAAAFAPIAQASIQSASNLEESVNAVSVSYGEAADSVLALGDDSAEAFGLSARAFNEFAVMFSGFADNIATGSGRQISDVVEEMTGRVADFASVMNLDVEEAAQVFRSSLAGESEPIRRFGIDLSAASVGAYAVANGISASAASMTEAEKVQARYGLLMQETSKFQGDFANTSDGLANSTRIAQAQIEDLQAKLGSLLIPAVSEAVSSFNDLVSGIEKLQGVAGQLPGPLGEIVTKLDDIALAASRGPFGFGDLKDEVLGLGTDTVFALDTFTGSVEELQAELTALGIPIDQQQPALDAYAKKMEAAAAATAAGTDAVGDQAQSLVDLGDAWAAANKPIEDMPATWQAAQNAVERLRKGQEPTANQQKSINLLMAEYGLTAEQVLDKAAGMWEANQDEIAAAAEESDALAEASRQVAAEYRNIAASGDWHTAEIEGATTGARAYFEQLFAVQNIASTVEGALDGLNSSIRDNGFTFDLDTEKGRANAQALQELAESQIPAMVSAYDNANGSIETFGASMETLRTNVMERLREETGLTEEQIADVVAQMGLVPENVDTQFEALGIEDANAKLALLSGVISGLPEEVQQQVTMSVIAGDPQAALDAIETHITDNPPPPITVTADTSSADTAGTDLAEKAKEGVEGVDVSDAFSGFTDALIAERATARAQGVAIGRAFDEGVAAGIRAGLGSIRSAATAAANAAVAAAQAAIDGGV